jgi:hypothetical protein
MSVDSEAASDAVHESLAAIDPIERSALSDERIEGALEALGLEITRRPRRPRAAPRFRGRRLGRPPAVLVIGAALIAVGSAVATGAVLSAHTGQYPTKAEEAMGGPGEALNPAAADFRKVALEVASDIPYPPGYESWRDFLISDEIRTTGGEGLESTGALHGWFAASAFCGWVHTWRRADLAGDAGAAASAAQIISQATSWKAVTDEDPHPDPSVPGDGGSTQYTLFGWMLPYQDAVLAGDRSRVEHLLATGYGDKCWTSDPEWREQLAAHPQWGTLSRTELARIYMRFLVGVRS